MVDWASWFMEGPEEVVVGLGLDEDIRLSRSMLTPSELHVVCLLSSYKWRKMIDLGKKAIISC